jgi:hypothetical protein
VESFYSCNYCGFRFSGKYGPDRRREARVGKVIPFVLSYQNQDFEASTLDFSEKGMGIKISGKPSIITGDVLDLAVGNLSLTAKVMWIRGLSAGAVAGLEKVH